MSGSTNAPYWPLSSAYFAPAAENGMCLVELCQGIQQGGAPPTCTAILASCSAGSTTFTTPVAPGQNFPCGYQSQTVNLTTTGTTTTIACGLISLDNSGITTTPGAQGGYLSIMGNAGMLTIGAPAVTLNTGVSNWPATGLVVTDSLSKLAPFVVASSSSSSGGSTKSSGIKNAGVSTLALAGGIIFPMIFFMAL